MRGSHAVTGLGVKLLREHLPDVLNSLKDAGAREVPVGEPTSSLASDMSWLMCRRTTYELVLRRAALAESRVRLLPGTQITGLTAGGGTSTSQALVVGVEAGRGESFPADLVVDASGCRSRLEMWLSDLGIAAPSAEVVPNQMTAYTRWYRLDPPDAPLTPLVLELGYVSVVLAPADNGVFSFTFGVLGRDSSLRQLRHDATFHRAAMSIPAAAPWLCDDVAVPISGVRFMGGLFNRLSRTAVAERPVVGGVVCLGDAAVCTNPRLGRGLSLALLHAVLLGDALDKEDDPIGVVVAAAGATRRELEPWYHDAVVSDEIRRHIAERVRAGESMASIGVGSDSPDVQFSVAAPFAVQRDPVVQTAFQRVWNLLEPPSSFARSAEIRGRVEAVWRAIVTDPPAPPGPSYSEFARILGEGE